MTQLLFKEQFGDLSSTVLTALQAIAFSLPPTPLLFFEADNTQENQAKTWASMRSGDSILRLASQPPLRSSGGALCTTSQESQDLCESSVCTAVDFVMAAPAYASCTIWAIAHNLS